MNELIHYCLDNLKNIEGSPNVDYNMPDEMYSEFNNELKSAKQNFKEHQSEFYEVEERENQIRLEKNKENILTKLVN